MGLITLNIIALLLVPLVIFYQGSDVDVVDYQADSPHRAIAVPLVDTLAAARVYGVKMLPVLTATEQVRVSEGAAAQAVSLSVADVVRRFTGVQVKDYGGAGGLKTVNVRSMGSEHVGIFLNGIQIDNAQNMQVDLGRFSTEGLSTVSLYSAQKSRRLQSAKEYASGAALYLNSARPMEDALRLRLRGGSFATVNPSLTWEKLLRRTPMAMRLTGDALYSGGRYPYDYFGETLIRDNADIRSFRLEAQLFGDIAGKSGLRAAASKKYATDVAIPSTSWDLHVYAYGSERGFPGPVIRRAPEYPFSAERQADLDFFAQGSWSREWSERYSTALRAKYSRNYTHYNTHPERNPMAVPYDLHYTQNSAFASLAHSYILAPPWEVDFSTDVQYNSLESDSYQAVQPRRTTFTGALATRLAWEKFRAEAHIVYQGAWDRFDDARAADPTAASSNPWARENAFRHAWMPGVTAGWHPSPDVSVTAYAKRTFRLPSFNDLYYTQVGNANLKPETATQTGADIRWAFNRSAAFSAEIRLSPYYNRVSDKIVAIPTASQFRWTMLNIGLADISGLDTRADAALKGDQWQIGTTLRYTYQRALDHSDSGSNYGNQIPYIPRHSGSIDINAGWKSWSFAWNTVLTGERWSRSANTADYYIEPWSTSDAAITWKRPIKKTMLTLSLSVSNIFNKRYQIVQGYPMPGTNAMLGATLSL